MPEDMKKKLERKIRIKLRLIRKKPQYVLWLILGALFSWVIGLILCIIAMVLLPALASPELLSGMRFTNPTELLNVDRVGQTAGAAVDKLRQVNASNLLYLIKEKIPSDIRGLATKLLEFAARWRELLSRLVAHLLAPRKIWEELRAFWERHRVKLKLAATKVLGIAISFVLFRLLMYILPQLGIGVLTLWGVNAGVLLLQWCVALVSPALARGLRERIGAMWPAKEKQKLRETGEAFIGNVRDAVGKRLRGKEDANVGQET